MESKSLTGAWARGSLSIEDAVKEYGIRRTMLYELCQAGEVVFSKVGARRFLSRASLEEVLAKGVPGSSSSAA